MPYHVYGWVEFQHAYAHETGEDRPWHPLLNLEVWDFGGGDPVCSELMGLGKRPPPDAPFAKRGAPKGASVVVLEELARNREFIAKYGEGNHGHTWMLLSELTERLDSFDVEDSVWPQILETLRSLPSTWRGAENLRFVMWGNW